jgi:hypothetical protein
MGFPASPAFVLVERGGGVGGERGAGADERGLVGAAGPVRGEATNKGGRAESGVAWHAGCAVAASKLPMVPYYSRAPTSAAPGFSPRAREKARACVVSSPWQPRGDERSRERGRGAPAAG